MKPINVLVTYDSVTGHVEMMARAVAEGVQDSGALVTLKRVDQVKIEDISKYDAFALGSPTHCGTMSTKMNAFINHKLHPNYWGKLKYKVAVAFTSSGGLGGGNEMTLWSLISAILNFGMMTFGIPDYVAPGVTLHYGAVAIREPDDNALDACKLLGRRLVDHAQIVQNGLTQDH